MPLTPTFSVSRVCWAFFVGWALGGGVCLFCGGFGWVFCFDFFWLAVLGVLVCLFGIFTQTYKF